MKSVAFSLHSFAGLLYMGVTLFLLGLLVWSTGMGLFVFLLFIGSLELWSEWKERYYGTKRQRTIYKLRELAEELGAKNSPFVKMIDDAEKENRAITTNIGLYTDGQLGLMVLEAGLPPAEQRREIPPLTRWEIIRTAFYSFSLVFILWELNAILSHMPGADIALELMK